MSGGADGSDVTTSGAPPTSGGERRTRAAAIFVRALWTTAILGFVIGAASLRVIAAGEREIAASTAALRAGDPHAAALHARRAAGWYAPGAPHVRVAYERLIALATKAEGLGHRDLSLFAWRAVRTAAIETRWLVTPHERDLELANKAIARLSAAAPRPPGTQTEPAAVIERQHLEALLRDELPRTPWIVVLVAAFASWMAGAVWLARRIVSVTGRVTLTRATFGLVLLAVGIAAWLLAIWRA